MAPIQKSHGPPRSTYPPSDPPTTGTIPKSTRSSHAPAHLNPALLSSSTSGVSSEANVSQPNSADFEGGVALMPPAPPQNLFLERIREQQDKLKSLRAQHWQMLQQSPETRTRSLEGPPPPTTALAQLEHRISMMSSFPPSETPEERPVVPSQLDTEYLDRLNLMNNDRGRSRIDASPKHVERDKSQEEMSELQDRLRSLQSMVNNLEQQHQQQPPIAPIRSSWESDRSSHPNRPSHDQMMVEMREQLRLQKELHLRRKELEDLMKKDIVESMQKNFSDSKSDISFRSWFHDDRSLRHLDSNALPSSSRSRRLSLSSIPSHAQASSELEYAKSYAHLQAQIDSLQSEIQRLNAVSRNAGVPTNPNEMGGVARPPPSLDPGVLEAIFQQQNQIQQLTNSLNQCFQGMMLVQRDVNHLQKAMDKVNHRQQQETSNERQQVRGQNAGDFDPWHCHLPDIDFRPIGGGVSRTNANFQNMGLTGLENSHATWLQSNPPSSFGHDPWNLNSQLNHLNDPDASGALNNQVAPGMRANNYWDNFRSFSRQNRLSNASPGSMQPPNVVNPIVATSHAVSGVVTGSGAPNVAQVTPRQLQANPSVPSAVPGNVVGQASDRGSSLPRQALIEPHFSNVNNSPPRPRRKQKINREQNRESSGETRSAAMVLPSCSNTASNQPTSSGTGAVARNNETNGSVGGAAAAAMVYPMPQNHDRNINRSDYQGQATNDTPSTPSNMMVNSLTTSIYQHIGSLINEYESRPDHLVRILQDIQVLGRSFPIALSRTQSEIEAPFAGWPSNAGPVYPEHLHDNRDNRHCMSASSPKVPADKRFSFSRSEAAANIFGLDGARGNANSSANPHSLEGIFHPFSSVTRHQGTGPGGAESDGGSAGASNEIPQPAEDSEPPSLMNNTHQPKRLASESAVVPKNVQRNQISRERDTRKFRREKPRNMQQAAIVLASNSSSSETIEDIRSGDKDSTSVVNRVPDESGFINVNFRLPMASVAASTNNTTVAQASSSSDVVEARSLAPGPSSTAGLNDMAEADQDQSPETSMQSHKRCVVVDGAKAYLDSSDEEEILVQVGSDEGGASSLQTETEDQMGLDRVPTRLSSHSLSQQRQNEELNLRSLVDEVLNTSSESELVEDALEAPPPPPSSHE
ncbi:hypothetical protein TCAL_11479 [Tigriopus californicus]|uniref:Pericentriolar material 1 protein C-terminal domain-containing protein n=1 Tax=Tigriopus californicus TaxID=6832 RepID=A0A553NQC1_TIGCA|nr:hypothetical protein TCAL_11479 [Tigriopus californicus]|eukprot:TCALIF_11479-PA protein Name:"Protein of unknown function" AED:0.10 eAED:0.19 QI:0/0.5/0.33/1/1/1/3/142/1145